MHSIANSTEFIFDICDMPVADPPLAIVTAYVDDVVAMALCGDMMVPSALSSGESLDGVQRRARDAEMARSEELDVEMGGMT